MKSRRNIIYAVALIAIIVYYLVDRSRDHDNSLLGTWQVVRVKNGGEQWVGAFMQFTADSVFAGSDRIYRTSGAKRVDNRFRSSGAYKVQGNEFLWIWPDDTTIYSYSFEPKKLFLKKKHERFELELEFQ